MINVKRKIVVLPGVVMEWSNEPTEIDKRGRDGVYIKSRVVSWWAWLYLVPYAIYGRLTR